MANIDATEPILQQDKSRYVLMPIEPKYMPIYDMYKKASSVYWVSDEINYIQDLIDFEKLSENEKHFILHVLAFFAASDGIVMENLGQRFMNDIPLPEAKLFYAFQIAIEAVHSETYSILIDTYVKSEEKKLDLFNAVDNFPAIKEKADWAIKWIEDTDSSYAQRLFGFAIVEGVFFSASFCAIFWLRSRGLLPGLTFANKLISRDESLHTDFACLIYGYLVNKLPEEKAHKIMAEAVDIEQRFITESIPCSMIGMNMDMMKEYIKFIADRLLDQLGYKKLYNAKNPFKFIELGTIESKANFFESRNANYSLSSVSNVAGQSAVPNELSINMSDDF